MGQPLPLFWIGEPGPIAPDQAPGHTAPTEDRHRATVSCNDFPSPCMYVKTDA